MGNNFEIPDIVRRKTAEEILAAEKERLAVTLRSIGDGVINTDVAGRIVLINKVGERLTGYTEEEAIGKPLGEIFYVINEKTGERYENPVEVILRTGGMSDLANRMILIARDGTERIIADKGTPIYDEDSNIIGVVLVFRDITEKEKMEKELLKMQRLESIGTLAGGIAHDFNNILTAILGNICLAKMYTDPGGRAFERLTVAEKVSMQARDLTRQLLAFSRGGSPVLKAASIAGLLRDSAGFMLRGSNVRCEFHIPDDLWAAEIDEGQISQVINNLVINGDQATPEGGVIKVLAENVVVEPGSPLPLKMGAYIRISVQDQGIGIPEEHLQEIFDPYFTTKQKGSGLGLAISHFIVKSHGGHIAVESQVGVGTSFFVYLPASPARALAKDEVDGEIIAGEGRILIMDDEETIRELACEMLGNIGYEVIATKDGAEAIELYKNAKTSGHSFDVVIMDLTVPGGMGGKKATRELTEIDPEAKVIVSSGYSNDPIMVDFREYGFSGVIAKPYRIKELSEILHDVISEVNGPMLTVSDQKLR